MRRVTLEQLLAEAGVESYTEQYRYIRRLLEEGRIRPVKQSPRNGRTPALHLAYWQEEEETDETELLDELDYRLSPAIGPDYYRRHPAVYREEAPWVRLLSRYLTERGGMPQEPVSLNERSFQIFGREKFLQREQGRKILTHCGVTLEQLEVYRTTEPLAYYSCSTKTPQNVLILENKDTFYSIRRHLLSGRTMLFGAEISTVIYGAGKGILRSFEDFGFCVEPHINDASNRILYFGDLDYEGIGIYERLRELFAAAHRIDPFVEAYEYMTRKAARRDQMSLPLMSEKQNRALAGTFFSYFTAEWEEEVCRMLSAGRYIPQEIINVSDYKKEPGDAV
ncbi:MAG: hypothetical protein HFI35_00080 [Roseburia sp.]|jgi:hypothetical protein|nr:hypothetical protein [Roseburia sp.]